jgi:hypothetical protein
VVKNIRIATAGWREGTNRFRRREGEHAPRLEGSRFISWQIYGYASGGSRKLPRIRHVPRLFVFGTRRVHSGHSGRSRARWVIRGSRLLHTHRTANLQSGSPPVRAMVTCH